MVMDIAVKIFTRYGLVMSFIVVGALMYVSYKLSDLTNKRIAGSAISITLGLVLAYIGGKVAGGTHGLADVALFSGIGVMGGKMLLNYGIVSTAMGVRFKEIRKVGFCRSSVSLCRRFCSLYCRITGCCCPWIF